MHNLNANAARILSDGVAEENCTSYESIWKREIDCRVVTNSLINERYVVITRPEKYSLANWLGAMMYGRYLLGFCVDRLGDDEPDRYRIAW